MKKTLTFLLILFLFVAANLSAAEKKAILLMIDGLRSDACFTSKTPNLDAIASGTWAEGYKGAYTYSANPIPDSIPKSAPNHVAILTGVTASKNDCFDNGETDRANYTNYPPISVLLKRKFPGLKSAWLYHWSEDSGIPTEATYISPPQSDRQIVDDAVSLISGSFPTKEGFQSSFWTAGDDIDLLLVFIDDVDDAGHTHRFSTTSPEYLEAVKLVDSQIGEILSAIRNRPAFSNEDWMITLCADHGGIDHEHGVWNSPDCYTTPLFVSSKETQPGRMKGNPLNCDPAAYILNHFTGQIPSFFDAKINEVVPDLQRSPTDGLVAYLPFNGNLTPSVGDLAGESPAEPPLYTETGKIGQALTLTGKNPIKFGTPDILQFGNNRNFTIAFWLRTDSIQQGRAPVFGNKRQGKKKRLGENPDPGILLEGNIITYEQNNLNFSVGDGNHLCNLNCLVYEPNSQWYFVGLTFERGGDASLYLGYPDGKLAFVSQRLWKFGSLDNRDWYLGQDGTGTAAESFIGDLDELMIWNRSLTAEEIKQLYQKGLNGDPILN